jgi:ribosomal protein L14E/L6E/L27E
MKPGRVVILLAGRHAGKKAIIVRQHDDGKKVSNFRKASHPVSKR